MKIKKYNINTVRTKTIPLILIVAILLTGFIAPLWRSQSSSEAAAPAYTISPDNKKIIDSNGNPLFINGEAAWSMFVDLDQAETIQYLDNRQAKGINLLMVNVLEYSFSSNPPNNIFGQGPFTTPNDYATPNETYFAHVDWAIQQATNRGFTLLLIPSYVGYGCAGTTQGWYDVMVSNGSVKMYNFGYFLGDRYKDNQNIIWANGGDCSPPNRSVVDQMALGLKAADPDNLHTAHTAPDQNASDYWGGYSWLDIDNVYNYSNIVTEANSLYGSGKPFFMLESTYENEYSVSQNQLRAQAYQSVLSGANGHVFGNCPIWSFGNSATFCNNTSVSWQTSLDLQGSLSMEQFGKLFRSRDWSNLVPDSSHTFLTSGYATGGFNFDVAAKTVDNNTAIAYFHNNRTMTFNLAQMNGSQVKAWWFNPTDGAVTSGGTFNTTGSQAFTTPGGNVDWVLVLDNDALTLPLPGQQATDSTPPTLTYSGANPILVERGYTYTPPTVTANDNVDGNITGSIVATGDTVNVNVPGTYQRYYNVQDVAGNNATQLNITVTVTPDVTIPTLTYIGANPIVLTQGDTYTPPTVTANDNINGNITGSIVITGDTVNTAVPGDYNRYYNVQDAAGNTAVQLAIVVRVNAAGDTTAPVLAYSGANPIFIERGSTYTPPTVTASDNVDGNITGSIVATGSAVNVNVPGTYQRYYNVQDAAGNNATQLNITVTITPDATAPTISYSGANPILIERGFAYTPPTVTASDNINGNITGSIVVTGDTVNVNVPGTYQRSYNVQDATGNSATQLNITVTITPDATVPIIAYSGANPIVLTEGGSYTPPTVTASDNVDGNITGSMVVTGDTVNVNVPSTYQLYYNVADSTGNNAAQLNITVQVNPLVDSTAPTLTYSGANPILVERGYTYTPPTVTANDNVDGNITGSIVSTGDTVNVNVPGTYQRYYNVQDTAGNNAVQLNITVTITPDATAPTLNYAGANPIVLTEGGSYTPPTVTASDNINGNITGSIVVTGDTVDVNVPADYQLYYNVSDGTGNSATQLNITVRVNAAIDVTAPVINYSGANPILVERGYTYTPPTVTASDNVDGDRTGSIVVSGDTVDANVPGTYQRYYNVQDVAGNNATQLNITVTVTPDVTAPVITYTGANPIVLAFGGTYTPPAVTANDNVDGNITGTIVVTGDVVNTNIAGDYNRYYNVQDASGNNATQIHIVIRVNTAPTPDGDGIDDSIEDAGLNGGDSNGDGMQDSVQANVAAKVNVVSSKYFTLQTLDLAQTSGAPTACTTITGLNSKDVKDVGTDANYDYPIGLVDFTLTCANNGDSADTTIFLDQLYDTSKWELRKYNSGFSKVEGAVFAQATVGSTQVTTITYTVQDGGSLDEDDIANGTIVDPVGPAIEVAANDNSLPVTGTEITVTMLFGLGITTSAFITRLRKSKNYKISR